MAFSAFLRAGDFGFAGSIVKFVSSNIVIDKHEKVIDIIKTSFTSVAAILGLLLLILYPIISHALPFFIDKEYIVDAMNLLPYSIVSVWLSVLGILTIFVFDGINRVDIRSIFLVVFNLIFFILSILYVNFYGFIGLGYAQLTQAAIQLIVAWLLVRKYIKIDSFFPFSWDKKLFKEMFSYSMHLQISSIMAMMLEPISKLLLGHFGSLSSVGYFEMANRLVMQIRNIVVNANQALVPMLSKAHALQEDLKSHYIKTIKILFLVSFFGYSFVALLVPFISKIWVGMHEIEFINFSYIVLFSLAINTISAAAYFTNMGTGDVRYNTYHQIIMAVSNLLFGTILGYFFQSYGVVISYGLSMVIGSLWLIFNFHIRNNKLIRITT